LKGFWMAKSAVDLDVNIVLSKYGFNGVVPFEIVMFGIWKQDFLNVFAFPSTLHAELNSLEKSSTSNVCITLRISNAIYWLAL